jgi:repressor LexA
VKALTQKQLNVLAYLSRHIRRYGYAPSIKELAEATGRSKTAAHSMLVTLERRGAIKRDKYTHRAIELVR